MGICTFNLHISLAVTMKENNVALRQPTLSNMFSEVVISSPWESR